jgi:ADP-heptose:LPS heptosyltransferase
MFSGTRLRVGMIYARFHFRRSKDPVLRFTEAISRARRALVILPDATKDITSIQWIVRNLAERFSSGSLTVVANPDQMQWIKNDGGSRYQILSYDPRDISTWFVPRQELLGRVKRSTFDVAFDLNVGFVLHSAFLCRESKAPLRVSFAKNHADEFYNFQVNTIATNSLAVAYRNLVRCMEMF